MIPNRKHMVEGIFFGQTAQETFVALVDTNNEEFKCRTDGSLLILSDTKKDIGASIIKQSNRLLFYGPNHKNMLKQHCCGTRHPSGEYFKVTAEENKLLHGFCDYNSVSKNSVCEVHPHP